MILNNKNVHPSEFKEELLIKISNKIKTQNNISIFSGHVKKNWI